MANGKKYKFVIWCNIRGVGSFGETFWVDLTKPVTFHFNRSWSGGRPSIKTLAGREIDP